MAKRTNKTDHVLNLLAGATKPGDTGDTADNKAKPPVDPLEMMNSNVSVHHTSTNGDAPIADAVKQNLERELLEKDELDVSSKASSVEEAAPKAVPPEAAAAKADSAVETVPKRTPEEQTAHNVTPVEAASQAAQEEVAPEAAPAEGKGETMQDTVSEEKDEMSNQETPKEEPVNEETPGQVAPAERTFQFVNVMECLVRDQAEHYMKQFGNCMCERCIEDVVALSLSHLPAKCVVVNKEAVSPLLNFYTKKYAGQITVEITKACIIVQENPNH